MGVQQVQLMRLQGELQSWEDHLVAQETTMNEHLIYLRSQLEEMDVRRGRGQGGNNIDGGG